MKIHEFQAKKLLDGLGVPVQGDQACGSSKGDDKICGGVMDVFLERLVAGET